MSRFSSLISLTIDGSTSWIHALGFDSASWNPGVWLLWLIMHFLWQGMAIAMIVYLLNVLGGQFGARFRHAVAVAGLSFMLGAVAYTAVTQYGKIDRSALEGLAVSALPAPVVTSQLTATEAMWLPDAAPKRPPCSSMRPSRVSAADLSERET